MNILVVGGAGYIGTCLCATLLQTRRECHVTIFDKSVNPDDFRHPRLKVVEGNILTSYALDAVLEDSKAEVVYHLASPSETLGSNHLHAEDGFLGSVKLIDACVRHKVKKFIFASSYAVYGETRLGRPVTESDHQDCWPISAYGVSKLAVEQYLRYKSDVYNDFYSMMLRLGNVYSETMSPNRVILRFMDNLLNNRPVTIYGAGDSTRDYIHLRDVVDALVAALEEQWSFGVFNVGTGIETRLDELLSLCEKVTGRTAASVNKVKARKEEVYRIALNSGRFRTVYDWKPRIPLEYGLRNVYEERYQIQIAMA